MDKWREDDILWTLPKKEAFALLRLCIEGIKRNPDINKQELKALLVRTISEEPYIPVSIFKGDLSPAEALCWYLHKHGFTYRMISELTGRDQRTVWHNANRAAEKKKPHIEGN